MLLLIGLVLGLELRAQGQSARADMVLLNGKIFTADTARPSAEALAVRGERIIAVGTVAEVSKLAGPKTRRIDLQGRVVTPGFNDAHNHFDPMPAGFRLAFTSMEPTWEETSQAIRAATQKAPAGTWIFGTVGSKVVLDPLVTRAALDVLAPNHPVLLGAFYGHGHIANTKALPLLQLDVEQPDPLGGKFARVTGSRELNGRMHEYAEWRSNLVLAAQVPDTTAIRALRAMAAEAASYGITTVQLFSTMPIDRFVRLLTQANLPVRVHARPFPLTTPQGRETTELRKLITPPMPKLGPRVQVSGLKWVLDGTPYERGAALRTAYRDRPNWKGELNFKEDEVAKMVQEGLDWKQPMLFHCAGDRAAEVVLNALEANDTNVNWPARRVRIEHGDGVVGDLIPRARRLGVVVVQNPTHFSEPALFGARWGNKMQPLRSLLAAGVPVALGSDGPMNPFLNIMFAVIDPANPAEAITSQQAVQAYTAGSAYAEFAEKDKGTLAVGKLADLVVLSQDIFAVPPPELPKTTSLLTIVGGKIVHDAKVLK
ncbi:amidohydrolase [Hymenobacter sp. BT188]|uniref:amidohydrolase n=1 Tax=Hymenobacter sp. BT188 TaxID=2763504 RepID=UPI0016510CF4|nr:amidohydrolase [Hymenobacter sp. BT188]MBC6606155.1 amidohydrolase [Hymenobacter sp. BT188]